MLLFYWVDVEKNEKSCGQKSNVFRRLTEKIQLKQDKKPDCCIRGSTVLSVLPVAQRMADTRLLLQCDIRTYQTLFKNTHVTDQGVQRPDGPAAASIKVVQDYKQARAVKLPITTQRQGGA